MIVGSEVETAVLAIAEVLEQGIGERNCELQVGAAPACLQQLEQRVEQERVVVQIRGEARLAILMDGELAAIAEQVLADEIHRTRC